MNIAIEEFNKIDLNAYEGYYWLSNAEEPKPIQEKFEPLTDGKIPFVIEGFLSNQTNNNSISIKNYNGKYVINLFDLRKLEENLQLSEETHLYPAYTSKLKGVKSLKFKELKERKTDEESGFSYWKKVANIFVGFVKM